MPENQNHLIAAVAAVQPNTVVVLHNGSAIEMPWVNDVPAVLELYLAGDGAGEAAVDLLYGAVNPSGKLAETFPRKLSDTPAYLSFPGERETSVYTEGVFVGYRYYDTKEADVLFPFGHGLSTHDFLGKVCRIILGITFQHRFQNDAFRPLGDNLGGRHELVYGRVHLLMRTLFSVYSTCFLRVRFSIL